MDLIGVWFGLWAGEGGKRDREEARGRRDAERKIRRVEECRVLLVPLFLLYQG